MVLTSWRLPLVLLVVMVAGLANPAAAQVSVSSADIQRLQDNVYQASSDVSRARSRSSELADRLQAELDELREEVIYLKVKLRKEGSVARREYSDLRDRIEALRSRARGEAAAPGTAGGIKPASPPAERPSTPQTAASGRVEVPVGTELDVRLQQQLSSETANVEDRFEGTTLVDLYEGDRVVVPAGSIMRGVVSAVDRATHTDRTGRLTVAFDQITIGDRTYPIRATVTRAIESEGIRGEAGRIGAGAGVGAIIGGILGGVRGALLGVLIGGGGTIAATRGENVVLPAGTVLRVRFDTPLKIGGGS
jgi:hypothetical protein